MSENHKKLRTRLNAERIATAALELIDHKGLDGFSFRLLARELGCEAMSIYHYFPSKAHLFDALVELVIHDTGLPPKDLPWVQSLRYFCNSFRAAALRHPGFFLYFAIYRMNSRAGLAFVNGIVDAIARSGLTPERQAVHFRSIGYYLMGAGLDESMGYVKGPSAAVPLADEEAQRDFPDVMAIGQYFGREHRDAMFNNGLDALLGALETEANARSLTTALR